MGKTKKVEARLKDDVIIKNRPNPNLLMTNSPMLGPMAYVKMRKAPNIPRPWPLLDSGITSTAAVAEEVKKKANPTP